MRSYANHNNPKFIATLKQEKIKPHKNRHTDLKEDRQNRKPQRPLAPFCVNSDRDGMETFVLLRQFPSTL